MDANIQELIKKFMSQHDKTNPAQEALGGLGGSGGGLINTSVKDAGGYTDEASAALDGAQKGAQVGGPVGAAIGGTVGLLKAKSEKQKEWRNNMERFRQAGQQQAADSFGAFSQVINNLR